jgi:hypothetical protein
MDDIASEAVADILFSGHEGIEQLYAAVVGPGPAVAGVLRYGSEGLLREALLEAGVADASERAHAAWWVASEYAEGRLQFTS